MCSSVNTLMRTAPSAQLRGGRCAHKRANFAGSDSGNSEMCSSTNLAVSENVHHTSSCPWTCGPSEGLHELGSSSNVIGTSSFTVPTACSPVTLSSEHFHDNAMTYDEATPFLSSLDVGSGSSDAGEELLDIFNRHASMLTPFEHIPKDQLPSDPFMYWRLSEEERCLLARLSTAYENTVLSLLQTNPPKVYIKAEEITTEYYFDHFDTEVRNVISFAKCLEDFQNLCTEEKVALLKASTREVLAIRSCALFVAEKDAWLTPKGYFTLEHGRILCPEHPKLEEGIGFFKIMKSIVKNDITLYALLHCIILFEPSDERIVNRQVINAIHDKYMVLLRHYLQSMYSYRHSDKYLLALLEKLMFSRAIHRDGTHLFKKLFPNIPNQLLQEVLDIE